MSDGRRYRNRANCPSTCKRHAVDCPLVLGYCPPCCSIERTTIRFRPVARVRLRTGTAFAGCRTLDWRWRRIRVPCGDCCRCAGRRPSFVVAAVAAVVDASAAAGAVAAVAGPDDGAGEELVAGGCAAAVAGQPGSRSRRCWWAG